MNLSSKPSARTANTQTATAIRPPNAVGTAAPTVRSTLARGINPESPSLTRSLEAWSCSGTGPPRFIEGGGEGGGCCAPRMASGAQRGRLAAARLAASPLLLLLLSAGPLPPEARRASSLWKAEEVSSASLYGLALAEQRAGRARKGRGGEEASEELEGGSGGVRGAGEGNGAEGRNGRVGEAMRRLSVALAFSSPRAYLLSLRPPRSRRSRGRRRRHPLLLLARRGQAGAAAAASPSAEEEEKEEERREGRATLVATTTKTAFSASSLGSSAQPERTTPLPIRLPPSRAVQARGRASSVEV